MGERWAVREITTGNVVGTWSDPPEFNPLEKKFGNKLRTHEWDDRSRFDLIPYPVTEAELKAEEDEQLNAPLSLEERITKLENPSR